MALLSHVKYSRGDIFFLTFSVHVIPMKQKKNLRFSKCLVLHSFFYSCDVSGGKYCYGGHLKHTVLDME